jgi:peroxiredoxin
MVEEGDTAPDFTLQGVDDFRITEFTLSEQLRRSDFVILSFYVFDFSPVCTTQVCELRDVDLFEMVDGVTIWGLAPDGPYAHEAFIDSEDLSFPLLCDTAQRVAETYDVLWTEKDGFERVPKRALFLVDSDRTVRYRWVAEDNWDEWTNEPFREMKATISQRRSAE